MYIYIYICIYIYIYTRYIRKAQFYKELQTVFYKQFYKETLFTLRDIYVANINSKIL